MSLSKPQLWQHPQQAKSSAALAADVQKNRPVDMRRLKSTDVIGDKLASTLIETLTRRLNDEYRRIQYFSKETFQQAYEQRVSFDTINIEYNEYNEDSAYDFLEDEKYPLESAIRSGRLSPELDYRGRGRDRDIFAGRSPSASPTRMLSPIRSVDMNLLFSINQMHYPSRPIITRKGCTFTRMHKNFEDLYLGNLLKGQLYPVLPGRVILIYISGRIHTWVSIDWIFRCFVEHGDTVVIVSSLPQSLSALSARISRLSSPIKGAFRTEHLRFRRKGNTGYAKQIAQNIMKYALSVVEPEIITKVIVEVAEGKTKDVLKDMYNLYEPNLVSTGSKINARSSTPLKSWNSSRLSDRLVKNFPLPVIVVPALNMSTFEKVLALHLEDNGDSKSDSSEISASATPLTTPSCTAAAVASKKLPANDTASTERLNDALYSSDEESFSDHSVTSDISANSEPSLESATSFHEIVDLYDEYQQGIQEDLEKLVSAKVDEFYFSNMIKLISDLSLRFCEDLRSVNPSFTGQGAKLARVITGSNSFGAVPYKTKSLLLPVELDKPDGGPSGGISISDLKKSLKMNADRARQNQEQGSGSIPKIVVSGDGAVPPQNRSLKFLEDSRGSGLKSGRPLKKFLSHDEASEPKLKIEPTKSHPDLRTLGMDEEKKAKKKKKKFWKLF